MAGADPELLASLGEVFRPGREEIERVLLEQVRAERDEPFLAVDKSPLKNAEAADLFHRAAWKRVLSGSAFGPRVRGSSRSGSSAGRLLHRCARFRFRSMMPSSCEE